MPAPSLSEALWDLSEANPRKVPAPGIYPRHILGAGKTFTPAGVTGTGISPTMSLFSGDFLVTALQQQLNTSFQDFVTTKLIDLTVNVTKLLE